MAFTKTAKPATTFSSEEKVLRNPAIFDTAKFDSARFDIIGGMISEAKPITIFDLIVKPVTTFTSVIKPATTFTKEAKPA